VVEETLERLSEDLYKLSEKKLGELELPEDVHDGVLLARAIESPRAKRRQLRLVRSALRDTNWSSIQERARALIEHGSLPNRKSGSAEESSPETVWVARLVGEGVSGLDAFLGAYARADRTHLRQLVRSVERASGERRLKAERKLRDAVRSFLAEPR